MSCRRQRRGTHRAVASQDFGDREISKDEPGEQVHRDGRGDHIHAGRKEGQAILNSDLPDGTDM